jgi:peptidoglycan-associated lipoprotein
VAMQSKQIIKTGMLVIALSALVACKSSSDVEEAAAPASSSSSSASSSAAPSAPALSQEEIRAQNALRQTVFYFDFDIAEFKAEDRNTLTYHARDLAANPNKRIRLEGHADERGTREYNLALGERRANGILNYLVVNGASRSQIEVVSYGEERPAQTGQNEQAYARNRRVEVVAR